MEELPLPQSPAMPPPFGLPQPLGMPEPGIPIPLSMREPGMPPPADLPPSYAEAVSKSEAIEKS